MQIVDIYNSGSQVNFRDKNTPLYCFILQDKQQLDLLKRVLLHYYQLSNLILPRSLFVGPFNGSKHSQKHLDKIYRCIIYLK